MFKREIQKNVPKLDQWKNIESVINLYTSKVQERNNNYQEIKLKEHEELQNNQEKKLILKELGANKSSLLSMRDSLHKEFLKIITLEKAALKKFENAKIVIEMERKKQIEKITEENMNKNKSGLLQIQKTYGDKAIKKIREKESQEIAETHNKQKETIKAKLDGVSSDISH